MKFVPKGPVHNIPALVQMMAWHKPGDKQLSEPLMVRLLMLICVIQPQWVKCCPVHTWGLDLVITVPADGLAPYGARPSAGTFMTTKLDMIRHKVYPTVDDLNMFFSSCDIIQIGLIYGDTAAIWELTHWGQDKMATIFANNIFKCIFTDENFWISNKFSLKYVPYGVIDNKPSLVQIMGCHQTGDKPLSEPMMA